MNGLKNKILNVDFVEYFSSFNIMILLETWVESKDKKEYYDIFCDYDLHWEWAKRNSIFGRAKGGILLGIKKGIKENVKLESESPFFDILLKTSLESVRIIPVYLSTSNWNDGLSKLKEYIERSYSSKIILVGDFNGRTGVEQVIDQDVVNGMVGLELCRKSNDRATNANGKQLGEFFNQMSFIILNGRFIGDYEGKFTFDGVMGKSVIDYGVATKPAIPLIKYFEIGNTVYSDHEPILMSIELKQQTGEAIKLLPKVKYLRSKQNQYNEDLSASIEKWSIEEVENVSSAQLVSEISRIGQKYMNAPQFKNNKKWYDKE